MPFAFLRAIIKDCAQEEEKRAKERKKKKKKSSKRKGDRKLRRTNKNANFV